MSAPPITPEDFERMRAAVDALVGTVFGEFVAAHGLTVPEHLGPYPRYRAELMRADQTLASIDFWMALDEHGRYFSSFHETRPFELSAGLSKDREEAEGTVRYGKFEALYRQKPFAEAVQTLRADLDALWTRICALPDEAVYSGRRKVIRKRGEY